MNGAIYSVRSIQSARKLTIAYTGKDPATGKMRTFATTLIKNGADIRAVQKMLGHSDLKTTQLYIQSLGIDMKKVHKATHPREKDIEEISTIKPQIERKTGKYERK